MLKGIFIIFFFQLIGEVIQQYFGLLIPGPVVGLILLLIALICTKGMSSPVIAVLSTSISQSADGILGYLSLLFIPIGVGVIMHLQYLENNILSVMAIILIGTVLSLGLTAVLFERLTKHNDD
ncbi:MAG: CidA/LrgA family protein [Alphaproteobacteria bacterium]|jgi:holin-like protein|nr:CidA/LrgA family protein [Alphaproteobacteria bacterium]